MRIRVESRRDAGEIRRLVRFACSELDPELRRVLYVEIADGRKHVAGNACDLYDVALFDREWKRVPRGARYRIRSTVPPDGCYPYEHGEHGIPIAAVDWREGLVWVTAHEAKHVEHFSTGRSNGYAGEQACDAFAAYVLDRFRS